MVTWSYGGGYSGEGATAAVGTSVVIIQTEKNDKPTKKRLLAIRRWWWQIASKLEYDLMKLD